MPSPDEMGPARPGIRPDQSDRSAVSVSLVALGLAVVLFGLGRSAWHPLPIGVWHDDGAYVLIAQSLAEGEGLVWSGVSGARPAAKFPPLFPLVASLVLRWGPDASQAATALATLNLGLMAAAGAGFFAFAVFGLGLGIGLAAFATLAIWTAPDLWRLASVPLSEPLFVLSCAMCLLAAVRLESCNPSAEGAAARVRPWSGPASVSVPASLPVLVAFAAAVHTRTIGVALLGATVAATLVRRRWSAAVTLGGAGALVVLPWTVWSRRATAQIPEPLRDVLGSYGGWLSEEMVRAPGTYLAFVAGNAWAVWQSLVGMLVPFASGGALSVLGALALPLAGYAVVVLGKRSLVAALFLCLYLIVVSLWPFQSSRLVTPVLPILALALVVGVRDVSSRSVTNASRASSAVLAFVGVAFVVPNLLALFGGQHLADFDVRARALAASAEAVGQWVPEDAVVGAPELWAGLHLYTGRVVSPSARFLPLASDGPSWGTPEQQYSLWQAAGIDHVLAEHGGGVHGDALDRMDEVCPEGTVELVATMPGALLTRLHWDAACRRALGNP